MKDNHTRALELADFRDEFLDDSDRIALAQVYATLAVADRLGEVGTVLEDRLNFPAVRP